MKRKKSYSLVFLVLGIIVLLFSCAKANVSSELSLGPNNLSRKTIREYNLSDNLVTEADIYLYCQYIERLQGNNAYGKALDVEPIFFEEELAAYAINFENGWQIVSSDKRGPLELAKSNKGVFHYEEARENVKTWLDMLLGDIMYRRKFEEEYYKALSIEDIECESFFLSFWKAVIDGHFETDLLEKDSVGTKPPPVIPPGHYVYSFTYTTTETDSLPHLLSTHWHQNNPYNSYIPYTSSSGTTRCPAGCTTIAGAQVLYYLHHYFGKPISSPMSGYCTGDYNSFSSDFTNYSSSTWAYIETATDIYDYRGLLIGDVAKRANVTFRPDGSFADVVNLKNSVFPFYGISGNYSTTYIRDTVYNNLKDNLPVIFGGCRYESLFLYPGHTWVIDGYVDEIVVYHDVYEWQYLTEPTVPAPTYPPYEITHRSPQLKYFKMNWGWGNVSNEDDGNYATSGSWANPLIINSNPYIYDKEIYSRFH